MYPRASAARARVYICLRVGNASFTHVASCKTTTISALCIGHRVTKHGKDGRRYLMEVGGNDVSDTYVASLLQECWSAGVEKCK